MGCFFDHDATVRSYKLRDGRTNTVKSTGPWTWGTHEIFQINADGKISQVEAVLLALPYGIRPGWDTGEHMPSPQAQRMGSGSTEHRARGAIADHPDGCHARSNSPRMSVSRPR